MKDRKTEDGRIQSHRKEDGNSFFPAMAVGIARIKGRGGNRSEPGSRGLSSITVMAGKKKKGKPNLDFRPPERRRRRRFFVVTRLQKGRGEVAVCRETRIYIYERGGYFQRGSIRHTRATRPLPLNRQRLEVALKGGPLGDVPHSSEQTKLKGKREEGGKEGGKEGGFKRRQHNA